MSIVLTILALVVLVFLIKNIRVVYSALPFEDDLVGLTVLKPCEKKLLFFEMSVSKTTCTGVYRRKEELIDWGMDYVDMVLKPDPNGEWCLDGVSTSLYQTKGITPNDLATNKHKE